MVTNWKSGDRAINKEYRRKGVGVISSLGEITCRITYPNGDWDITNISELEKPQQKKLLYADYWKIRGEKY